MTFDEAQKDEYCLKILNLLNRWLPKLPKCELQQMQLIALWEACDTFDINRKCKFTTHLYNRVRFKYLKHINRKSNHLLGKTEDSFYATQELSLEIFFDGLSEQARSLLEDKYVNRLNLNELTKKYGVKRRDLAVMLDAAKEEFKNLNQMT